MPTLTLLNRATSSDQDMVATTRAHLAEAEEHAGRAAAYAAQAAEHYGNLAARATQRAADTLGDRVTDTASHLREDAEDLWEDPERRRLLLQAVGGVAVVALAIWLWRRWRRTRRQDGAYETSPEGVAGWTDPEAAFAGKRTT